MQDCGFILPTIDTTSRICLILYTDNDYQRSGFKLKAGTRHSVAYYCYEMNRETGELWIHQHPGTVSTHWRSPEKASTTHQYLTTTVTVDHESGVLTLDGQTSVVLR